MENERDRQLREAAKIWASKQPYEKQFDEQYHSMYYSNDVDNMLSDFAKSESAKQYWQEQFKQGNDAIEFAEWCSFEGWHLKEMDIWENSANPNLGLKTSVELYELFKTNKTPTK